jgi:F0F1-type ATP synthase assembly protein I
MKAKEFYTHFTVAYGSCFLVVHVIAAITQSHIATGPWGYYGFPLVGLGYAIVRTVLNYEHQHEVGDLKRRIDQIELQQLDQKYKLSDIERNVHNQSRAEAE